MKAYRSPRRALLLAALGALTLATARGARAEDKILAIGCSLPLSGPMVGFGQPIRQGMELAVALYNASGKLPGARFKLDCNDSKGDAKEAVTIAERLADDPAVIASISDFTSTATMAAADTYGRAHLVELTPSASHPAITGMNPWMFRSSETVPSYIEPLADFTVKTLGKKRVALIQVQTDWGQSVGATFTARVKADGGEVVATDVYNAGTTDFRAILTKLRRTQPEAIFLAMLEEEAATFMKQRAQLGLTSAVVVDSGVGLTDRSLKVAGHAFDGMWSERLFDPESKAPEVQRFIAAFKAKYSQDPDIWSAYGWDAATLVMQAAQRAWPDVTRQAVRDQLAATGTYQGANGSLSIDPATREVSRQGLTVVQVQDGRMVYDAKP